MAPVSQHRKDALFTGLGLFIEAFRPYVVGLLRAQAGERWPEWFAEALSHAQRDSWLESQRQGAAPENLVDFHHLKAFAIKYRDLLKPDFGGKAGNVPNWLAEIADVRHRIAHYQDVDGDDATKAWIHLRAIAKAARMPALETELTRQEEKPTRATALPTANLSIVAEPSGPQPWFRVVDPHFDIREGRLDESVFAANLAEVARQDGSGREMYANRTIFFGKTYPTQGLLTVARRIVKGLNGQTDAENRVIALQTGFGGGKTHTLISLWHLGKAGRHAADVPAMAPIIAATGAPTFEPANVAVFTNATNDVANGRHTPEGLHIQTIWGELAYQLGGAAAYEIIRRNDEQLIAPAGLFRQVLAQCRPALILIDELADYCVKASARSVGNSTLSDQTISFVQELTEAVAATDQCVVVFTLPASVQEVGNTEQAQQILASLQKRVGRIGADTQPVADEEIFEVIRRRLFEDLGDEGTREAAITEYIALYQQRRADLPAAATQAAYRIKLRKAYPFHPELIDIFRLRWASHHNFQRTRGALRLLAAILSDLYRRQQSLPGANLLIHTSDVNLTNLDPVTGKLKELYGNGYDAVITADVAGTSANAFKIDQHKAEYRSWNLTQGIATTILLNSFGSDGANKGLSVPEIKLSVLKPHAFNHNTVNSALDELEEGENGAHYLHYTQSGSHGRRYWFHTRPNVNILINQADISVPAVEGDILSRISNKQRAIQLFNVLVDPTDDVPEQQKPTLIILSPEHSVGAGRFDRKTRNFIETRATKRNAGERIYRNTLLFLLCTEMGATKLRADVRDYLACCQIRDEYQSQLDFDQRAELKRRIEDGNRQAEDSLAKAYAIIAKHSAKQGTQHLTLTTYAGTLDAQLNQNLLQLLKSEEWLLESVGLSTLRQQNLLPTPGQPIRTKDVYEAFLRFDDKPLITNVGAVSQSLLRYMTNGEFAIAAGDGKTFSAWYYRQGEPPYFDLTDPTYWLVDKSEVPPTEPAQPNAKEDGQPGNGSTSGTDVGPGGSPAGSDSGTPIANGSTAKAFRSITVSGRVALENYSQLFTSFLSPLRDNSVEIEIRIKGKSTTASPLTESTQLYKVIKESAQQLNLKLDEELG